jgi:hypothetical protein
MRGAIIAFTVTAFLMLGGVLTSARMSDKLRPRDTRAISTAPNAERNGTDVSLAELPPQKLPVYGGSGGDAFDRDCGAGRVLTGLRFRSGKVLDAVGLLCRPVLSDGKLGPETTVGSLTGGGGGTSGTASCESRKVVVAATIWFGWWVDSVSLYCRNWNASTRTFVTSTTGQTVKTAGHYLSGNSENEQCESSAQPAHAIRGRSHDFVDAFGLICDEP